MKIRINNILPLMVMLFLAGLTLWLRLAVESPSPPAAKSGRHDPDSIAENFTMRRLSATGTPQYFMSAIRMLHYSDTDSTELVNPLFSRTTEDGARITIRADGGTMTNDAAEAVFFGHVVVRREATALTPEFVARTERLQILAESGLLRTDRAVTIQDGPSSLTGIGMEYNKRNRQFTLLSQAKGSYRAPAQK